MGDTKEEGVIPLNGETKPDEDSRNQIGYGVDDSGFFKCSIHVDRGPREVLGFLEQCKDIVKQYYASKFMEEQKKKGLIRPNQDHGFMRGFRNKWRH